MNKLWAAAAGLVASAAFIAPAGAATNVSSGDTCSASGNGTAYTVVVSLPSTATEQGGFAFGASGVTVKNIILSGNPGTLSTQSLPLNTSAAWMLSSPASAVPGSQVIATLKTSKALSGSLTVVPSTATPGGSAVQYLDPITCSVTLSVAPSAHFIVHGPFRYDKATRMWSSYVSVAGRGRVNIGALHSPNALIHNRTYAARGAGKVKIYIVPTAVGVAQLKATGMLKIRLSVQFSPRGGKPASKLISLTLRA